MTNFDDFNKQKSGDSVNLTTLEGKSFTIVSVEKSDYKAQDGTVSDGVKITTVEKWETKDGEKVNKIHTTRRAVVSKLTDAEFLKALDGGETFKVRSPLEKVKNTTGGQDYFDLVAAV